jgi:uncharacterized damage-inducible protein DinB
MITLGDIIQRMKANAEVIRSLVGTISDEQAQWQPGADTWSMAQVMEHVYNEERIDFRKHLKEMLSDPPQPWGEWNPQEYVRVASCRQALDLFLTERDDSIAWLQELGSPDWNLESRAPFGPAGEELVLKFGDVLVSWVAHDFLHIRQMNELQFAWNEAQAAPYSVQYAGGW